ncbi:MAG: ribosome maturation factor RimP [Desulfobulbaceae bacterium]|nr:ribosome maturation factor RimP [Desulfobulbaceae bacterium]
MSDQAVNIIERVEKFISPLLADMGIELVEIQFRREGHGWVLRLFIDRQGGVTLENCTAVSREVSRYLEVEDPIEQAYHLEVSSPGLERPLKKKEDYIRFSGRRARVKMQEKIDDQRVFIGTLKGVEEDDVVLSIEGQLHYFPLAGISRARLILE